MSHLEASLHAEKSIGDIAKNLQFKEPTIWETCCAWIETAVSGTLGIWGSHP